MIGFLLLYFGFVLGDFAARLLGFVVLEVGVAAPAVVGDFSLAAPGQPCTSVGLVWPHDHPEKLKAPSALRLVLFVFGGRS